MKIVIPPLVVSDQDAFKNDAFSRRSFGESLARLVLRSKEQLVISLDGRWGEGKTTFIKMWQGHLNAQGMPSIYIDAFENDYSDDAFISIAGAITGYIDNHSEGNKASAFKETAKKVGVQILSWSSKVAIKAATLGAVGKAEIEGLEEIGKDVASDSSAAISDFIKDRLSAHSKEIESIRSFKEELSRLPTKIKGNESDRLVIVIDELDRCKPSFAVEVIEKIKHLFSVPNIIFLLVMNKEQLEESIKSVYGSNIDAHTYLQKFINIETSLPKRISDRYGNDLNIYSKKLLELHELETWGDSSNILDCVDPLARHFNLSLRQLERVYTNIAIVYSTSEKDHLRLVPIVVFICVLKVVRPRLFDKLSGGKLSFDGLLEGTALPKSLENDPDQRKLYWMMQWMRFTMLTHEEFKLVNPDDEITRFGKSLWQYDVSRERLAAIFCAKLNMFSAI